MACGVVLAPTAGAAGRDSMMPAHFPGIRIPVAWVRNPAGQWMRDRQPDREVTAADAVACLGHRLPVWAAGTHDAASVTAWRFDGAQVPHAVPRDLEDMWRICQYAASSAAEHAGRGFVELATQAHRYVEDQIRERNMAMEEFEAAFWRSAVSLTPPSLPDLPNPEPISLLNAANLLHGGLDTPPRLGDVLHRLFGDPTRGAPMVFMASSLPGNVIETVRRAPLTEASTPRTRRLLSVVRDRYRSETWQLHQDSHDKVDHLYAFSDTHVAWLAAGDWSSPHLGHSLLPEQPQELLLACDESGAFGGWVSGLAEECVPFPFAGTPGHACVAIAEILTGRPLRYAFRTHLERLLDDLPRGGMLTYQWHTAQEWAAEFLAGEPSRGELLSYKATVQSGASVRHSLTQLINPASPRLAWDEFGFKSFEDLICQLADADGRFDQCRPHANSGSGDGGVDVVGTVIQPVDPHRPYLAIQCKRRKSFRPANITAAVNAFLKGDRAAGTDTFILAVSHDLATPGCALAMEKANTLLAQHGIKFEVWQDFKLSQMLRGRPDLVTTYFSEMHAKLFCRKAD